MPTDPNFEARAQKVQIFQLHDGTAYNASTTLLAGKYQLVSDYKAIWVWFVPAGSYDGTVNFETSPDGGATWFSIQGFATDDVGTLVTSVAAPVSTDSYMIYTPTYSHFRARMSGGTTGSLSAYARLVDFRVLDIC